MLGALTYHTIAALAKQRLEAIDALLLAKIRSQNRVTALDRQVRFLARTAHETMSFGPHLPTERSLPPFARNLSLYTVLGSIGPNIPQFAALYAPGASWLYDTIHGGNPDPNRQRVLARSTDFLLTFADRWSALINGSGATDKDVQLKRAAAYVAGHACHIAADVVSAPFISSVAWERGDSTRPQLSPEQAAGAIEQAIAQLLRRDLNNGTAASRGNIYKDWWLDDKDLPVKFFDAFNETLEAIYGPGAAPQPRPTAAGTVAAITPQTSNAFWKQFQSDAPPTLSQRLLTDGYSSFRAEMEGDYVWNWGNWLGATAIIFFPPIAAYPLIVAMPHTRALFHDGADPDANPLDKERGWFGLVMAPLVTSALAPLSLSIFIAARTYFGVGRETVFGWIVGGVNFITSIVFLATMSTTVSPVVRWLILFVVPFIGLLVHAIYVLARGGSNRRHTQLALGSLLPCIITAVYVLYHLSIHRSQHLGMNGWLKDGHWGSRGFIAGWAIWAAMLIGGWMILSAVLRRKDPDPAAQQFVTGQNHFLRLFSHTSMLVDPNLSATPNLEARNPSLAVQYFPTERRPLLNIWWEGAGDLFLRSDRNALQFNTKADGTGTAQSVLAPAAPMTAGQFARFLNRAVQDGGTFSGKLKAELADATEFDYVLAPGAVFSDNGDDKTIEPDHRNAAAAFVKLKTTHDDPTVLFHAPRAALAAFQGKNGPVFVDFDRTAAVAGPGKAQFAGTSITGNASTRFASMFAPGDVIATTGLATNETRIVAAVQDDLHLTVTMPFTAAVAGPQQNYQRGPNTRDTDTPAGNLQSTAIFRVYRGTGFDAIFVVGDIVRVVPGGAVPPEERVVTQVISGTQIMVDKPFGPALPLGGAPAPCLRAGRLSREGFAYVPATPGVPSPLTGIFAGNSLMERAADLAAILAMGAASHLLPTAARGAVTTGPDEDRRPGVNPVYQVFRNWNLRQRRVNEWQMLVGGNAISEKRGQPKQPDPLQPGVPAGWTALTETGEQFANQLGWLPLMQKWLDVAGRPGVSSLADTRVHEGDPTNKELSQGVAFLFDLPMPA